MTPLPRALARATSMVLGTLALASAGCPSPPEDRRDRIAAAADLTTRQLLAALNASSAEALAPLLVLTSTAGGGPRPLRPEELRRLMLPDGPFEYVGAGRPGEMLVADGAKTRRAVRLVEVGDAMKVLATSEPLSAYLARETGTAMAAPEEREVRVLRVLRPPEGP